jgi:hypothetical protein
MRTIFKVLFFSSTAAKLVDTRTENLLRVVYTDSELVTHELANA